MNLDFDIPVKIRSGKNSLASLGAIIGDKYKNILIVTDTNIVNDTGIIPMINEQLDNEGILYDRIEENPSFKTIDQGGQFAKNNNIDLIIGIGGGSSLDAAKGIAVMGFNSGMISDYVYREKQITKILPLICIPTTSGTGSEVTPFAVFTDPDNKTKSALVSDLIFPTHAIIDPALTYTMPVSVIINTGLDALSHCIEAFLSEIATTRTRQLALNAIKIIVDNLENASGRDHKSMDQMAYASMLGGIVITQASTILPHIMGYPLTVLHQIPHGRASIIMIPAFLDYLERSSDSQSKLDQLTVLFKNKKGIRGFLSNLGVSTCLSDYGINREELEDYVQHVITKDDIKITPTKITTETILKLYLLNI